MESEMFGHERGALTGATVARRGRLELAALIETGGHRRRAAERLGIGERTLYETLKRYHLS